MEVVWGLSRGKGDRSSGKDSLSVAQSDRPGPTPVFPPQVSTQPEEGEVCGVCWCSVPQSVWGVCGVADCLCKCLR